MTINTRGSLTFDKVAVSEALNHAVNCSGEMSEDWTGFDVGKCYWPAKERPQRGVQSLDFAPGVRCNAIDRRGWTSRNPNIERGHAATCFVHPVRWHCIAYGNHKKRRVTRITR